MQGAGPSPPLPCDVLLCPPALTLSQMFHELSVIPLRAAALMFDRELCGCRGQGIVPSSFIASCYSILSGALPRLLESLQGSDVIAGVDYWDLSSPCSLEILRFLRLR